MPYIYYQSIMGATQSTLENDFIAIYRLPFHSSLYASDLRWVSTTTALRLLSNDSCLHNLGCKCQLRKQSNQAFPDYRAGLHLKRSVSLLSVSPYLLGNAQDVVLTFSTLII